MDNNYINKIKSCIFFAHYIYIYIYIVYTPYIVCTHVKSIWRITDSQIQSILILSVLQFQDDSRFAQRLLRYIALYAQQRHYCSNLQLWIFMEGPRVVEAQSAAHHCETYNTYVYSNMNMLTNWSCALNLAERFAFYKSSLTINDSHFLINDLVRLSVCHRKNW